MATKSELPPYFKEYLDQKFKNMEAKIEEINDSLIGKDGICTRLSKDEDKIVSLDMRMSTFRTQLITVFSVIAIIWSVTGKYITNFFDKLVGVIHN